MSDIFHMGCDPGSRGAIVLSNKSKDVIWFPVPLFKDSLIDLHRFAELIRDIKNSCEIEHCVLENVHSIPGASAKSNFNFGRAFGIAELALAENKIPYTLIEPKKWQMNLFQGIPEIKRLDGKRDTKAMALLAIKRLYPNLELRRTTRCKNPDEGLIDALCMNEYSWRHYGKQL